MKSESLLGHLFLMLSKFFIELVGGFIDDDRGKSSGPSARTLFALVKICLVICAILAIVGIEVIKVLFQWANGSKEINFWSLGISIICFFALGLIGGPMLASIGKESYLVMNGIFSFLFYNALAIYLTLLGYRHWKNRKKLSQQNPYFLGDNYLIIWFMSKKMYLKIILGILLCLLLGPLSIPILFCGLSVWIYKFISKIFGSKTIENTVNEKGFSKEISEYTPVIYS